MINKNSYNILFKLIIGSLFLFSHISIFSQQIYHLGVEQGLSGIQTFNTLQDKTGFVWISTRFGIDRFDSKNVKKYPLEVLYNRGIVRKTNVLLDRDSLLWAYTDRGAIYRFDDDLEEFLPVKNIDRYLRCLHFDFQNRIWLGLQNSFAELAGDSITEFQTKDFSGQNMRKITDIDDENLLIATNKSLFLYEKTHKKIKTLENSNSLLQNIESILFDKKKNIVYIGSVDKGLLIYDLDKQELKQTKEERLFHHPILTIMDTDDNYLLLGTEGLGMCLFDKTSNRIIQFYNNNSIENTYFIDGDGIYDISKDKEGRIWLSSFSNGVFFMDFSPQNFQIIRNKANSRNSLSNNLVSDILCDSDGNLWFATNNGLNKFDQQHNRWQVFLNGKNVLSLFEDTQQNIWVGTYSSGLYKMSKNGKILENYINPYRQNNSIGTNFVYSICEDSQGKIWSGGKKGRISCFNPSDNSFAPVNLSQVNCLIAKDANTILAANEEGVWEIDIHTRKFNVSVFNKNLKSLFIHDMLIESDSIIWLGTYGDGLNRCNMQTGTVESFKEENGLSSNFIYALLKEKDEIWMSSENGLICFNIKTHIVRNYFTDDGISYNKYRSLSKESTNGKFYFGSYNGVTCFIPEQIEERPRTGKIFLQDFYLFNKRQTVKEKKSPLKSSLESCSEIRLNHLQHSFSIDFTAIDYTNSQNRRFVWMLEGVDKEWITPTGETTANYTNISPGQYIFRLQYLDDNNVVLDERELKIIVTPPFWNTTWAQIIEILLVIALAVGIYFYIRKRIRKKQTQERIDFFLRMARDIRNPLTLIKAPIYELKDKLDTSQHSEYLFDTVIRNLEKLISLFAHLLDYRHELDELTEAEVIEIPETITRTETEKNHYKILLIEGDEELRNFLLVSLKNNMEVIVSEQPEEAWRKIQTINPDIIITDLFSPELSGFVLLEKIKNTFETSHIPVIMLSTTSDKQLKIKALHLGVDSYVEKPFEITELESRIENILNNRKLLRRKFIGVNEMNETPKNELDAEFIRKATNIVEQNLTNTQFSVSDFSKEMGLSKSLLYTKFNALTGYTPNDYIKIIRMKKAIEYFGENKYSINEVAFMIGFEDAAYFSNCFKKIYGMSPKIFIETNMS